MGAEFKEPGEESLSAVTPERRPGGGKVAPEGTAFHGQRKGVPDPNAAETPV